MTRILALLLAIWLIPTPAWALCEFVNAGTKGESASGNFTLGAPATPATNDIWIAVTSSTNGTHAFTDWTQIHNSLPFGNVRFSIWYFRYAGSTPNLIITSTSSGDSVGAIAAFRGCDTVGTPVDTLGTATSESNTQTVNFATITPSTSNTLVLAAGAVSNDAAPSSGTMVSNFTQAFAVTTTLGADRGAYLYYKAHTSGATGGFTATLTGGASTDENSTILLALEQVVSTARRRAAPRVFP